MHSLGHANLRERGAVDARVARYRIENRQEPIKRVVHVNVLSPMVELNLDRSTSAIKERRRSCLCSVDCRRGVSGRPGLSHLE